jgi:hypothetical protein
MLRSADPASKGFWRQILTANRDTFVVPSDGLVIMQRLKERPVPLPSYINGSYRNGNSQGDRTAAEVLKLGSRRYTSSVDLDFAVHLGQISGVDRTRFIVCYARDLRVDELRTGTAVLIGSIESNPWIQIFDPQVNFRQRVSTKPQIPSGDLNRHAWPGQHDIYGAPGRGNPYGLTAYLSTLSSTGHILIVGGLNTAGTQAATNSLPYSLSDGANLAARQGTHGQIRSFEFLVRASDFSSNAITGELGMCWPEVAHTCCSSLISVLIVSQ